MSASLKTRMDAGGSPEKKGCCCDFQVPRMNRGSSSGIKPASLIIFMKGTSSGRMSSPRITCISPKWQIPSAFRSISFSAAICLRISFSSPSQGTSAEPDGGVRPSTHTSGLNGSRRDCIPELHSSAACSLRSEFIVL